MDSRFEFPAPVLSVAGDVVRQLEGGEALTGLWTLFTKCKASLEDGHRLENMSWRLWHRELAATTTTTTTGLTGRAGRGPVSDSASFGKIIIDMLPHKSPASLPIHCQLPTPAASELYLMPPFTLPDPVPRLQIQPDPSPTITSPAPPLPQLVIVHPTPGPTPPASPLLSLVTSKPVPADPPSPSSTHHSSPKRTATPDVPTASSTPPSATATAPDTDPSPSRSRAPGAMRQTGSAPKSKSRSRSHSRSRADRPARAGLLMTAATGKRAATGGAPRGRAVGLRKSASAKGGKAGTRDKRPTFNIGSHSDDVGSKSAGSGSSVSNVTQEGKREKMVAPLQRQHSAAASTSTSRLMPPPPPPPPLRHPLPDPATVLPSKQQPPRRTIVLSTSDSDDDDDYETETDVSESDSGARVLERVEVEEEEEGDTADWSSEDMSADDVEFVRQKAQPQRSSSAANATTPHPNNTNPNHNHTHTTNTNTTHPHPRPRGTVHSHLSRAHSRRTHAANAQYVVEQAALEAERIREMFAKKPVPSSEDLAKQRTQSVGLLSQLMHPDPEMFPPTHPYRGHSSGDVKGARMALGIGIGIGAGRGIGTGLEMTSVNASGKEASRQPGNAKTGVQQRRASAGPVPGMSLRKGAAATPVASQVQVGSVGAGAVAVADGHEKGMVREVYRPKGRPADQEMEDTESEGDEGDATNGILVSKSVAQQKLEALAARKGIMLGLRKEEEAEAGEVGEGAGQKWARQGKARRTMSVGDAQTPIARKHQPSQAQAPTPTPAPIPLGHPYNLPPAAPPSTPRTTRRLMLQTEMSESLRRNLLWERQVSKVNLVVRRSSSGGGGSSRNTVLGGGPLRPLTALPSIVQLTAKRPGSASASGSGSNTPAPAPAREHGRGPGTVEEQDKEERKKRALARNRSWANEFHYTGW